MLSRYVQLQAPALLTHRLALAASLAGGTVLAGGALFAGSTVLALYTLRARASGGALMDARAT